MNYQNFDLEIISTQGGERLYARVLDSPQGDCPLMEVKWPFQAEEESQLLAEIYGTLRQRRARSGKANILQDFGGKLFDAVFAGDIEHLFRSSLDAAFRAGQGLRVRLRLPEDSDLHARPWEYLFDTERREFLAVREHTPLVRYLPVAQPIAPITVQGPLRILVALSSPSDHPRLDITREWDILWKALAPSANAGHIKVRQLQGRCTFDNLRDELRSFGADIFHFVGHGVPGALVLEEEMTGKGLEMEATQLRAAFSSGALPRLIVLNACSGAMAEEAPFSGLAQGFLRQGVPAVVAMQASITDDAAVIFTRYFYRDLVETGAVDAALTEARLRMQGNGHPVEWGTPVLYLRALNGQLFQPRVNQEERDRHRENQAGERASADTYAREPPARGQQPWAQRERERAARESEAQDLQEREQQEREQEQREQEQREQEQREQRAMEQAAREHRAREQQAKDRRAREQDAREQQAREQQAREQQAREQEARERRAREQQAWEQEAREQQARDRAAREQAVREQAVREQAVREQQARARAASAAEARQSAAAGNEQKAPAAPGAWEGGPPGGRKTSRPTQGRENAAPPRKEPNLDEQDFRDGAPEQERASTRTAAHDPEARTERPQRAAPAGAPPAGRHEPRIRLPAYWLTVGLALVVAMLTFGGYKIFSSQNNTPPYIVPAPRPVPAPAVTDKAPTPALPDMSEVGRADTQQGTNRSAQSAKSAQSTKSIKSTKPAPNQTAKPEKTRPTDTSPDTVPKQDKCKRADVSNSLDCWFPDRGGVP